MKKYFAENLDLGSKKEKKLPIVLSRKEVNKVLSSVKMPAHHACLKSDLFYLIPKSVWKKNWVKHIEPVGNGLAALKYLTP